MMYLHHIQQQLQQAQHNQQNQLNQPQTHAHQEQQIYFPPLFSNQHQPSFQQHQLIDANKPQYDFFLNGSNTSFNQQQQQQQQSLHLLILVLIIA